MNKLKNKSDMVAWCYKNDKGEMFIILYFY